VTKLKKYEAYIHTNGSVQVKRMIPELGLEIDRSSPFVSEYLGVIDAENYEEAMQKFREIQDKKKEE